VKIQSTYSEINIYIRHNGQTFNRVQEMTTKKGSKQVEHLLIWYQKEISKDDWSWNECSIEKSAALELIYQNIEMN